jgi:hypothetical protein
MSTEPATEAVSDPTAVQEPVAPDITEKKTAPIAAATKKKPAPKKRIAKKPTVKKKRVAKKAAVQKRVAKKGPAKKKKAKKRVTKKAPAKRVAAKKSVAKKAAAKKSTGKKSVARPATAKKSVVKKRAVKKTVAKKSAPSKAEVRPNSNSVSKAQAIRDMAKEIGGMPRPRDIIATLAAKGIQVVSAQVSTVLKAAGLRKNPNTNGASGSEHGHGLNSDQLLQVKTLAEQLGGIEKLRQVLGTLQRLL